VPSRAGTADADVLRRLIERRHSARAYLPDPVPRALVEAAFEMAGRAPSWCNTQPWHVVVTEGEGTERFRKALGEQLGRLAPAPDVPFPASYTGAHRERRLRTAVQLYDSVGIARDDRGASRAQTAKNFELFGAPHVAILSSAAELGPYGAVDCGVFLGNLLLAFESLGVAAVPQAALATYATFVREHFGLDATRLVLCGISFGWKDPGHPVNGFRTEREPLSSYLTWST